MSDMSNYLENALINATFRNTAYTSSATVYVALYTAVTDAEAGTGTEVANSASYARTAVTFGAPSNGVISNSSDCTFRPPMAATGAPSPTSASTTPAPTAPATPCPSSRR